MEFYEWGFLSRRLWNPLQSWTLIISLKDMGNFFNAFLNIFLESLRKRSLESWNVKLFTAFQKRGPEVFLWVRELSGIHWGQQNHPTALHQASGGGTQEEGGLWRWSGKDIFQLWTRRSNWFTVLTLLDNRIEMALYGKTLIKGR